MHLLSFCGINIGKEQIAHDWFWRTKILWLKLFFEFVKFFCFLGVLQWPRTSWHDMTLGKSLLPKAKTKTFLAWSKRFEEGDKKFEEVGKQKRTWTAQGQATNFLPLSDWARSEVTVVHTSAAAFDLFLSQEFTAKVSVFTNFFFCPYSTRFLEKQFSLQKIFCYEWSWKSKTSPGWWCS